ncbi:ribonuclease E inhibitor RraB [Primorskyibacter sedentarius]|uniref:ribonuclease E inhibitor RraB n=1 Tax=Primorskyibacter sedentarius TaxID=745311 RepID=UPI003EB9E575
MSHDFDTQKDQTFANYAELSDANDLPDTADVDYFFLPAEDDADWRALADALSRDGYDCEFVEDDGAPYLVATLSDQAISAASIWMGEEVATRVALSHGFTPDGWGFEA